MNGRRLAITTGIVFFISLAFPLIAGLSNITVASPRLWGVLDVAIAAVLATLVIVTIVRFDRVVTDDVRLSAYHVYRLLTNVVIVLLVVFFLAGDRVKWNILLPGLAWRAWFLFYGLPA